MMNATETNEVEQEETNAPIIETPQEASPKQQKTDITHCKHCDQALAPADLRKLSRKPLPEKFTIWGGIEYPYIQIVKVQCPNKFQCGKKYTARYRGSNWLYK